VSYDGDPLEIGFNASYLLEVLRYMPTDEVRMTFKAPERAATIEPMGWNDAAKYLCLVMPLRLVD
jgi:DNA polymerase III subunit beta